MAVKSVCAWLLLWLLAAGPGQAWAADQSGQQDHATSKKVTAACLRDGQPVSPCDVVFKARNAPYTGRCVTASSGMCQWVLTCCKPPDKTPINWDVTATTVWGIKKQSLYTNCGWTCDEEAYVRFDFTGMKQE